MPALDDKAALDPATIVSERSTAENFTGNWRTLRPDIDAARCTGCLICWKYCPEACIQLNGKVPRIIFSYCKGCGICVRECPPRCIGFKGEVAA